MPQLGQMDLRPGRFGAIRRLGPERHSDKARVTMRHVSEPLETNQQWGVLCVLEG